MSFTFQNPFAYFNNPANSNPVGLGKMYIGLPDTDPITPANQIPVYAVQPDGSELAIPQPVRMTAGGVLTYNGTPIQLKINADSYSVRIDSSTNAQLYYTARAYRPDIDLILALAATNSTVLVGGVEAGDIIKNIDNFTTPEREGGLVAALATGKPVWLRQSTDYAIASLLNIPNDAMIIGSRTSRIVSSVNGTAIQCGAGVKLIGFQIVDDGSQPNAKGINIAGGFSGQEFIGVEMEFAKECVTFEVDGGSGFSSMGGSYYTRVPIGTGAAIKVNGTDTQAIPRKFINPESRGCTLFDFGGCNDFFAANFYSNGLIYSDVSSKVIIPACRIGAAAGSINVRGSQHLLDGIYAAPINVYAINSLIEGQSPGNEINDFGTGNSIEYRARVYTPVVTASGGGFVAGDGSFTGVYSRSGGVVTCQIDITFGSSTVQGAGEYSISLPVTENQFNPVQICGSGLVQSASGIARQVQCIITPGTGVVKLIYVDSGSPIFVGAGSPVAFTAGSTFRFTMSYYTP